jgi:hypothetical protein
MKSMPPKNNYYRKKEGSSGITNKKFESDYDYEPRGYRKIQSSQYERGIQKDHQGHYIYEKSS